MDNYIIVYTECGIKRYITGKIKTRRGVKSEILTFGKFEAKFYMSEKVAQGKAYKLNSLDLYKDGIFSVEKFVSNITCR